MRSMEVVTALLAIVMCLTIGWMFGVSSVAADCRIAGVFRVKNEAFACHPISAGKEGE